MSYAQIVLRLVKKEARKVIENIIQLLSGATFVEEKLRRHVKGVDYCKRLLENSRDEALATEVLAKEIEKD